MKKFHFKHSRCWSQQKAAPVSNLCILSRFSPFFNSFFLLMLKLRAVTSFISYHTNVKKIIKTLACFLQPLSKLPWFKNRKNFHSNCLLVFFLSINLSKVSPAISLFYCFSQNCSTYQRPCLNEIYRPYCILPEIKNRYCVHLNLFSRSREQLFVDFFFVEYLLRFGVNLQRELSSSYIITPIFWFVDNKSYPLKLGPHHSC